MLAFSRVPLSSRKAMAAAAAGAATAAAAFAGAAAAVAAGGCWSKCGWALVWLNAGAGVEHREPLTGLGD